MAIFMLSQWEENVDTVMIIRGMESKVWTDEFFIRV